MNELPLVLFTVLSQMAAGATVTLYLLDYLAGNVPSELGRRITVVIIAVTGIGLVASLVHLGEPLAAYRALAHLSTSWLSREIALFGIFIFVLLLYYRQWIKGTQRLTAGAAAALVAILAVWSSGMVYILPARPAWNNVGPVLFFFFTAASLGPLLVAFLYHYYQHTLTNRVYFVVAAIFSAGLFSFGIYATLLRAAGGVATLTGNNLISNEFFWPRIIIGWGMPLFLLLYTALKKENINKWVLHLLVISLIGELLGRNLFYSTIAALQVSSL